MGSSKGAMRRPVASTNSPAVAVGSGALIFGAVAMWVRSGPVGLDAGILQALEAARSTRATEAVIAITNVGRGPVTATIVALVAAWLSIRAHWEEAAFLVIANLGSGILSLGLQEVFARPRPPLDVVTRITGPASFSFPSGHALSAMVLYTSLAMIATGLGLPRFSVRRAGG